MHHGDDANVGATGEFPEGKLNQNDEGEIRFGVAADREHNKIILNFGKPVAWIGMSPGQAIALADLLRSKARFVGQ